MSKGHGHTIWSKTALLPEVYASLDISFKNKSENIKKIYDFVPIVIPYKRSVSYSVYPDFESVLTT